MTHTDTIAICIPDWYGVRRALHTYTETIVAPAEARETIDRLGPRVVLFGCYLPEWEPLLEYAHKRGCVTVLTWYASYALNDFNNLNRRWMYAALDAYRRGLFSHIATPHRGLAKAWSSRGYPTSYLPLTVDPITVTATPLEGVHIGIMGSGQPWKNMECQLVAASLLPHATIHVQHPPERRSAVESLNIPYVLHPYVIEDAKYYELIGSMTVNLCVSMSETYSYLTAESFFMGTPVLTSHITPIVRDLTPGHVLSVCRTPWFDDPYAIAEALRKVIAHRAEVARVAPEYMRTYNDRERVLANELQESWYEHHSRRHRVHS